MTAAGTVVVADDALTSLHLLTALLTRDGYAVHGARDGEKALALTVERAPELWCRPAHADARRHRAVRFSRIASHSSPLRRLSLPSCTLSHS
jgi:CheY-like chemotaxis protein